MVGQDYKKGESEAGLDYGWRFQGKPVLLPEDRSAIVDGSSHLMQMALTEMSKEYFSVERCLQCGMCTEACPNTMLNTNSRFSPRKFIQELRLGLIDFSGEDLWFCTNCGSCVSVCPYEIPFIDVMKDLRNLVIEQGAGYLPQSLKSAISSCRRYQNPWMEDPNKRADWSKTLNILTLKKDNTDGVLLFVGCLPSYDERGKKIAKAATLLLDKAGINFDFLGEKEVCCGDGILRSGDYRTFEKLKKINTESFEKRGIKKVYTISPHCFDVMKNHYFEKNEDKFLVAPFILLLYEMLTEGRLKINKPINKIVTFHDPCFLSKHNHIVSEPREILKSLPGIELREMEHHSVKSICCGGGGGGIWLDRKKGERLTEIRLEETLSTKADILVTACPLCLSMLEDTVKNDNRFEPIEVMDICELVLEGI
ncbi:MAG TPA: Fe-S oxidoreductase [Deltaproteobacteria bacterium]|nr:Fe-S oxidoreductase [Deltaproteobacteria bacterium]